MFLPWATYVAGLPQRPVAAESIAEGKTLRWLKKTESLRKSSDFRALTYVLLSLARH
jgi:hypothetical protein